MKKTPFALVLAFGLASGSAFAATSGTVEINGEIVNQTCTISNGDERKIVNLAPVNKSVFTAAGVKAAPETFTIALTDCDVTEKSQGGSKGYYAAFSAEPSLVDSSNFTLINQAEDGAGNVNVALYEESGQLIQLGNESYNASTAETKVATDGATTLVYSVAYYSTSAATDITPGLVTATANYVITYK